MQAHSKELFDKNIAPASAVSGPTSSTTDTDKLSYTNPADDFLSSTPSSSDASAHPGATPTSHEGAHVPSIIASTPPPAAIPTANGAVSNSPGGSDMTCGSAANGLSVPE